MSAIRALGIASLLIMVASCSMYGHRSGKSSSLVDFLYPAGERPPEFEETVPVIKLPARVGLAFVPGNDWTGLSELEKSNLLELVKNRFEDREFIDRIEIVPTTYLKPKGGFDSLEQIGRLYDFELVALVSYDQVINSEDTASSLLYWTIVGAYIIPGTSNKVSTFVDTAVFDIQSQQLLFRAPGLDERSKRSTGVGVSEVSRTASEESFEAAMSQMAENLDAELERFKLRIEEDKSVQLVSRTGGDGSGTGSMDLLMLFLLMAGIWAVGKNRR